LSFFQDHKIQFEHGEKEKVVHIAILDDKNKEDVEEFGIRLLDVQGISPEILFAAGLF
jgi:hypothetical protein